VKKRRVKKALNKHLCSRKISSQEAAAVVVMLRRLTLRISKHLDMRFRLQVEELLLGSKISTMERSPFADELTIEKLRESKSALSREDSLEHREMESMHLQEPMRSSVVIHPRGGHFE
jgi:hypothetical protein